MLPRNPDTFGGTNFHRTKRLLLPGSVLERGPHGVTVVLQSSPRTMLPHMAPNRSHVRSVGRRLSPVHFPGIDSRPMNCNVLIDRWLFLVLLFGCLGIDTPFGLTFGRHFGA